MRAQVLFTIAVAQLFLGPAFAETGDGKDLWRAIEKGDLTQVERLVQSGAPLTQFLWNDESPLMTAARRGREDMVDLLLKNGASATANNRFNKTPLMSACESSRPG